MQPHRSSSRSSSLPRVLAQPTPCARCVAVPTLRARESLRFPEIVLRHPPLRAQVADLKTASEPSADVLRGLRRLPGASFAPRGGCRSTVHVQPRGLKGARPPSPRIHPTNCWFTVSPPSHGRRFSSPCGSNRERSAAPDEHSTAVSLPRQPLAMSGAKQAGIVVYFDFSHFVAVRRRPFQHFHDRLRAPALTPRHPPAISKYQNRRAILEPCGAPRLGPACALRARPSALAGRRPPHPPSTPRAVPRERRVTCRRLTRRDRSALAG